jgi:TRAP-type C4-dicarboxylate transport system permease small subunit
MNGAPEITALHKAARPLGLAAAALLVFMMLHTTWSVVVRQVMDVSILSLVEYSELVLMWIIFLAIPGSLLRDETIVVDVIDSIVPKRVSHVLYIVGLVLTLAFLIASGIAILDPAMVMYDRHQYTIVMEIDRFQHWIPILFGFYCSILAVAWLLIRRWRRGESHAALKPIE